MSIKLSKRSFLPFAMAFILTVIFNAIPWIIRMLDTPSTNLNSLRLDPIENVPTTMGINEHDKTLDTAFNALQSDEHKCQVPIGFPQSVPSLKRFTKICQRLYETNQCRLGVNDSEVEITKYKKIFDCSKCIPPWASDDKINNITHQLLTNEKHTRNKRQNSIKQVITNNLKLKSKHDPLLVITLNFGYSYLFLNWLCGLERFAIAPDLRDYTLILATDIHAHSLAKQLNFTSIQIDNHLLLPKNTIEEKAVPFFSEDYFGFIVALKIIYTFDLISLGYDIIHQDADVVWFKNVRNYIIKYNKIYSSEDIIMTYDGRHDHQGPGNGGFIVIKSNCKTKIFLNTFVNYIGLVTLLSNEQIFWNMFLQSYDFRQIKFSLLSPNHFVNGHQWRVKKSKKHANQLSNDIWFAHASWTGSHVEKITKFMILNAWFLRYINIIFFSFFWVLFYVEKKKQQ